MSRSMVFALLAGFLASLPTSASAEPPTVIGLQLGVSTLGDVLVVLGSPASTYLSGEDAEYAHPRRTDAVVLRYERPFRIGSDYTAGIYVTVSPPRYVVQNILVMFGGPHEKAVGAPLPEVLDHFGPKYKQYRAGFACGDDALECGDLCLAPDGPLDVFLYQSLGLQIIVDRPNDHAHVKTLFYGYGTWRQGIRFKPCISHPHRGGA